LSNPDGDFVSTRLSPSRLFTAEWDASPGAWSAPQALATGVVGVANHALAARGQARAIALARDPDPADRHDGVIDLYTWDGTAVSVTSLAKDAPVDDRQPALAYDAAGTLHLVWRRGADLVHSTSPGVPPGVLREGSESMAFFDIELLASSSGVLTLLWQEVVDNGPANIFARLRAPGSEAWSSDRRITVDDSQAHSLSALYGQDGVLRAAYLATAVERGEEVVEIGGEAVTVGNIPLEGVTDLRLLAHSLIVDLAVSDTDIATTPEQPAPGGEAIAAVTVHNAGDYAVGDFDVALYGGLAGDLLLGSRTVTGPLKAGDRSVLTLSFEYPDEGGDVVVVVDSGGSVTEFSEVNNRARQHMDNQAPIAYIEASATTGTAPLTVALEAVVSGDPDGDAVDARWSFGDGSPGQAGPTAVHTFEQAGEFQVTLTVTDGKGAVGTSVVRVDVQ
jgi:hypothetical protein